MLRLISVLLRTLALALAIASCTSYEFRQQDICFRHDAEADAIELIVVSNGLLHTGSESEANAAAAAGGARHVILFGWPFEFDLAKLEEQLREASAEGIPLAERARAWTPGVAVDKAVMWTNDDGELSLYQRLTLSRAGEGVTLLNEAINQECLREETWKKIARDWDARSGELWEAHVRAGRSWVELAGGGITIHVPVSPEGAARCFEEMMRQAEDGLVPLVEALSAVTVADGRASFAFRPDETGWVRLLPEPKHHDDPQPLPASIVTQLGEAPAEVLRLLATPRSSDVPESDEQR